MPRHRSLLVPALALLVAAGARGDTTTDPQEAHQLVARWLDAQNRGDLAAYQALYAERFAGVRRSGPRTVRLDRAGWMKDRVRMFRKPMLVAAEGIRTRPAAGRTVVDFTQTWSSGGYRDVGLKRMVLVREAAALRIAEEEMLESHVLDEAGTAGERFAHVDEGELVVSTHVDEHWIKSFARQRPEHTGLTQVALEVDVGRLPARLAAWRGRKVRLYGARGPLCEATVGDLVIVGKAIIDGMLAHDIEEASRTPEALARAYWEHTEGAHWLVAKLEGACKGAQWARAAELPEPAIAPVEKPAAELLERARHKLRELPAYDLLASHDHDSAPSAAWDAEAQVEALVIHAPGADLLSVSLTAGVCGELQLWTLWQIEGPAGHPRLRLRSDPTGAGGFHVVLGAFDPDGQGHFQLLTGAGRYTLDGKADELSVPGDGCI
jgi:hypothetical protein